MKVALTGSKGFIGKHLINALQAQKIPYIEIQDIFEKNASFEGIDHIFHLAAKTFIPQSWENPTEHLRVNALGTQLMLEEAVKSGTSFTYLSTYMGPSPDTNPVTPTPYGLSKSFGEQICSFYATYKKVPVTILRLANVYGPGQKETFLIPTLLKQMTDPQCSEIVLNDLTPRRDWTYVTDIVDALLHTIPREQICEIFPVGTGIYTSVEDVIKTGLKILGIQKPYSDRGEVRPQEVMTPRMDCTKITEKTGWKPRVSLEAGLRLLLKQQS